MTTHLKPREQGDLGEFSAMQWFAEQGAHVFLPLGHSPDVDLVARLNGRLVSVEVKTSGYQIRPGRWQVHLATQGGNQSWSGMTKYFDPDRCDLLYVHVGDGRRWLIPTAAIEGTRSINVGGRKYAEFEIDSGKPLLDPVEAPLESCEIQRGSTRVGDLGGSVKSVAQPEWVRIPPPPFDGQEAASRAQLRPVIKTGRSHVHRKRTTTLPRNPFDAAGLAIGDYLRYDAIGEGQLLVTREASPDTPVATAELTLELNSRDVGDSNPSTAP